MDLNKLESGENMLKGFFGIKGNEPNGMEPLYIKERDGPSVNVGAIAGIIIVVVFIVVYTFFV